MTKYMPQGIVPKKTPGVYDAMPSLLFCPWTETGTRKPKTEKTPKAMPKKKDVEKMLPENADKVLMRYAVDALRCCDDGRRPCRRCVSTSQVRLLSWYQPFDSLNDHTQPPPPPSTASTPLPPSLRLPPDPQPHPRRRPPLPPLLPHHHHLRLPRRTPTDPLRRKLPRVFLVSEAQRREIQREQIVIRDMTVRAGKAPTRSRG